MINLESLEQAFAEVEAIGKGEKTFDVGGTPVTLSVLLPQEETAVQDFASQGIEDAEDDDPAAIGVMNYLDRFKLATLSYALVQVGDLDLRKVSYLPSGETLPNGKEVKIPKHEALMNLVSRWSSPVRDGIFRKYGELLNEIGDEAAKAIKFSPSDLDAEIERVEERLADLKAQKENQSTKEEAGDFTTRVNTINELGEATEKAGQDLKRQAQASAEPKAEATPQNVEPSEPQAAPSRRSAVPQQATPPTAAPTAAIPNQSVEPKEQPKPYKPSDESLVDSSNLEAAVEAENRRLFEQRMAGQQAQSEDSGSVLDAVRNHVQKGGRVPPHLSAQQVAESLPSDPVAQVGGAEAFRLDEPQTLGTQPSKQGNASANINPQPQGKRNPRFRPPNS